MIAFPKRMAAATNRFNDISVSRLDLPNVWRVPPPKFS